MPKRIKLFRSAITDIEFSLILSKINFIHEENPHVGICFSGGSDSCALLILMSNWIKKRHGKITAIHFNHNLRKDSLLDVQFVKQTAKRLNVNYKILDWNEEKPISSLMKKARDMRYKKIIEYCEDKSIITLMTGHHLNDSLETFFMRKQRKFSTIGLTSIPVKNNQKNLQILRPFLEINKERLIKTCVHHSYKWIEDPSNNNEKFERVRIRNILNEFDKTKFKKIHSELKQNCKKNIEIENKIVKFAVENLIFLNYGLFKINKKRLINQSEHLKIEILKKILVTCSGTIYPPKTLTIKMLLKKLKDTAKFKFSIHSCIVNVLNDKIEIYREYQKIKESMPNAIRVKKMSTILWDNRFKIRSELTDFYCYHMNDQIWLKLRRNYRLVKLKQNIKYDVLKTFPVIKIKNKFVIPFLRSNYEMSENSVKIEFTPKIPITKKNF